jgi:hypothetical protein
MNANKLHKLIICLVALIFILPSINTQLSYRLVGAVTDSSFTIKTKSQDGSPINVYTNNVLQGTYSPEGLNYYTITIRNLTSSTVYNVNLLHNSISHNLSVKTFPKLNEAYNLNFIVSSTAYTNSNSFIYEKIESKKPDFFMMLGNAHNEFISSSNWKDYETTYLSGMKK